MTSDAVELWADVWRKAPTGPDGKAARAAIFQGAADRGQRVECYAGLLLAIFGHAQG